MLIKLSLFAQEINNSQVTHYCVEGTAFDSSANKGVANAFIEIIFKVQPGKAPVVFAISDSTGYFKICSERPVRHIKISLAGYESVELDNSNRTDTIIRLKMISLKVNIAEMTTITAKRKKEAELLTIEKKTYSVSQNILATGGTALDALKQIPAVNVDNDGNISLRGSANVTIYINGKQSSLTGADRQALLLQIPAANIESIDVNTNPGAKQDAEGQSGIINITLKQNTSRYKNGYITLGTGTHNKYNGSAAYNSVFKKLVLTNVFSFRQNDIWNKGYNLRDNHSLGINNGINQYNTGNNLTHNYTLTRNIDYKVNPSLLLSLSNMFSYNSYSSLDLNRIELSDMNDSLYQVITRNNVQTNYTKNIDAGLTARKTFDKPSHNLITMVNFSSTGNNARTDFVQNELNTLDDNVKSINPFLLYNTNNNKFSTTLFQLDYTKPLKAGIKLETGLKSTSRNIDNNFIVDSFNTVLQSNARDLGKSNHFLYNENVNAAYGMVTHTFSELIKYNIGLRVENTGISGTQLSTNEKFGYNYTNLFPSGNINLLLQDRYKFPDIQMSYSRRINRPGQRDLNPFLNFSDPYNLSKGNPNLKPELTDAAELSAIYGTNTTSFTATLYGRQTSRPISRYATIDSNGVSTVSQVNLGYSRSVGGEVILRFSPMKNMKATLNGNFYQYAIAGNVQGNDFVNKRVSYSGKANLSYQFWRKTDVQASFNYMGPFATAQGVLKAMYALEIGGKKDIIKDKLSLSINLSDVFNNRRFAVIIDDLSFDSNIYRKRESRILTFNLTWKFGKTDLQAADKKPRPQQDKPGDTDF